METKKHIRKLKLEERDSFSKKSLISYSDEIQQKVIALKEYQACEQILLYLSIRNEVHTNIILEESIKQGKSVFIPKVINDNMEFYKLESIEEVESGYKGILEPKSRDHEFIYSDRNTLIIVPGVAFNKNRKRIGFGKGFYDRYLCEKPNIIKVALAYSFQIVDEEFGESHDVLMDKIVTENVIYD